MLLHIPNPATVIVYKIRPFIFERLQGRFMDYVLFTSRAASFLLLFEHLFILL